MEMYLKEFNQESGLYTREYLTQEDICRFCWSKDAHRCLYEKSVETRQNRTNDIIIMIKEVLNIDLSHENALNNPNKVCDTCVSKINNFYEFKQFCQNSQKELLLIIENSCPEPSVVKEEQVNTPKLENYDNLTDNDCPESTDVFFHDVLINTHEKDDKEVKKSKTGKYMPKKTKYYCYLCHINLPDANEFTEHNLNEHGIEKDGKLKCFGCPKMFPSKQHRGNHERQFCPGLKDGYKCQICNSYLPSRKNYIVHVRDHRSNNIIKPTQIRFECKKCKEQFMSKRELNSHTAVHAEVLKKSYVCETCGRVFSRQDYLFKHKFTHTGEKRRQCPHCSFRTTTQSNLVIHIRRHTGERPYACDLCPQRCVSNSNLRAHRRRHTERPAIQCHICPKKFGYKSSLKEHIEIVHEKQIQSHLCPQCGTTFTRAKGLKRHLLAKHGVQYKDLIKPAG